MGLDLPGSRCFVASRRSGAHLIHSYVADTVALYNIPTVQPTQLQQADTVPTYLTWRVTLALVAMVSLLRLLYLAFLCPYELVADEAQYWDWSRRLDICYYSKGPGIAWLIAASTRILGSTEWTVRLPAVLCGAVAALAVARLAMLLTKGDSRAGFYAAALILLTPAYQATALLMTIDAPFLACWALALFAASHVVASLHRWPSRTREPSAHGRPNTSSTRSILGWWLVLGLALGIGMLFKYTMLLFLPGLLVFCVLRRLSLHWDRRALMGAMLMLAVLGTCAIPVVVWNHRHDWPTYRHLLGNLELPGGDRSQAVAPGANPGANPGVNPGAGAGTTARTPTPASSQDATSEQGKPLWRQPWVRRLLNPLEFIGVQLALVGPAMGLLGLGIQQSWSQRWRDGQRWSQQFLLICVSAGVLIFYAGISLMHQVEGNWPIAAYLGLTTLAGAMLTQELPRYRELVKRWRENPEHPRPRMGYVRRQPETPAQVAWHWTMGYGLLTGVGMMMLVPLSQLPGFGRVIPVHRFMSSKPLVAMVQRGMENAKLTPDQQPLFMAESYGETALLAFYLPGQPVVHSAASYLGSRKSSYDFFADTNLADPTIVGRPVVLTTTDGKPWRMALRFRHLRQVEPPVVTEFKQNPRNKPPRKVYVAEQYLGLMPQAHDLPQ